MIRVLALFVLLSGIAAARENPITALAESPSSPVAAVSAHDRILLYDLDSRAKVAELPFPEGIPYVLRFSRDGSILVAGGGKPVQAGSVALYDMHTKQRIGSVGREHDIVLAADISPDGELVAMGGPTKVVKVYSVHDGKLLYEIRRHTDWITALEFSPDGSRLATADRSGGIYLWDATTGSIIVNLAEHKDSVTSLSWRADSKRLASVGEDGELIIWDTQNGFPASMDTKAHTAQTISTNYGGPLSGILGVTYRADGTLLTIGRDSILHWWGTDGKPAGASTPHSPLLTKIATGASNQQAIVGDYDGRIWLWNGSAFLEVGPASGR
jgi:WD40 repeat protein